MLFYLAGVAAILKTSSCLRHLITIAILYVMCLGELHIAVSHSKYPADVKEIGVHFYLHNSSVNKHSRFVLNLVVLNVLPFSFHLG